MSLLINNTGLIGVIINYGTVNVTGSLYMTLLMMAIIFIAIGLMFRMPIEWIAIFLLPMALVMLAMDSMILGIVSAILLFFAILFIRNLFIE